MNEKIRSTTVICVRRDGHVVMAGDGQVTLGHEVLKASAKKLRRLYNDKILAGFAGSTADAFSLFARFETKLEQFNGNLSRSVVELAKDWRTDKILRHLEALLLVADTNVTPTGSESVKMILVALLPGSTALAPNSVQLECSSSMIFSIARRPRWLASTRSEMRAD